MHLVHLDGSYVLHILIPSDDVAIADILTRLGEYNYLHIGRV